MTASFMEISRTLNVDISFQEDNMYRRNRRLCFDMDSTFQTEVIDELADRAGEETETITESAMNGEIDFSESFKQRMALLEGLSEDVLKTVAENLPITRASPYEGPEILRIQDRYFVGRVHLLGKYLQKELGSITFTLMNWKL
jgi:phosphoserine phosphatase